MEKLELKNKKTAFDVQAREGVLSIENARVNIDEKNNISEFTGSLYIEHSHCGNFYYSERNDRVNCNVSDVAGDDYATMHNFVHACIDSIKAQISTQ